MAKGWLLVITALDSCVGIVKYIALFSRHRLSYMIRCTREYEKSNGISMDYSLGELRIVYARRHRRSESDELTCVKRNKCTSGLVYSHIIVDQRIIVVTNNRENRISFSAILIVFS